MSSAQRARFVDEPSMMIVVTARAAAKLVELASLKQLHFDHRGEDPDVDEVLVPLLVAAEYYAKHALVSDDGRSAAPISDTSAECTPWRSTADVATLLAMSERHVRRLRVDADVGSLFGRTWLFTDDDIAAMARTREHR